MFRGVFQTVIGYLKEREMLKLALRKFKRPPTRMS